LVEPELVKVETDEHHQSENTTDTFLDTQIEITKDNEDFISKNAMYDAYVDYMIRNVDEKFRISQKHSTTLFKNAPKIIRYYKDKLNGDRSNGGWVGCQLITNVENIIDSL
jgi:hypothetical protein